MKIYERFVYTDQKMSSKWTHNFWEILVVAAIVIMEMCYANTHQ